MSFAFEVTILGCSSATPTSKRFPTAQLLNMAERFFLIDCGEGTQIQLRRYHIRFQRINHIFISHLHGDHYLGLMGLLSSFHLLGRKTKLNIYHPEGLKEIIDIQLNYSGTVFNYEIEWHVHPETDGIIFEDTLLTVETIKLDHRIPCRGFIFREKQRPFTLDREKTDKHRVPVALFAEIKKGNDITLEDGTVIPNKELTKGRPRPRSYAFCSDTRFSASVTRAVKGVDLLYHEATFLHEMIDRAEKTFHSTAKEAGITAKEAGVKQLLIGHYSVRYLDLRPLLEEAKSEFPETLLAEEGKKFSIAP
ncbi:MAG TPA: ribonuclease Z [Bacteroidia bacterium]|nr:ribonuclease Z [Bacteroidia bacterium]